MTNSAAKIYSKKLERTVAMEQSQGIELFSMNLSR